jgi:exonuclease III
MNMRFATWNIRSSASSLKTVASKLAKYKLHSVGVQEVRWDEVGIQPVDDYRKRD